MRDAIHGDPQRAADAQAGAQWLGDVHPGVGLASRQQHRHHIAGFRPLADFKGQRVDDAIDRGHNIEAVAVELERVELGRRLAEQAAGLFDLFRPGAGFKFGEPRRDDLDPRRGEFEQVARLIDAFLRSQIALAQPGEAAEFALAEAAVDLGLVEAGAGRLDGFDPRAVGLLREQGLDAGDIGPGLANADVEPGRVLAQNRHPGGERITLEGGDCNDGFVRFGDHFNPVGFKLPESLQGRFPAAEEGQNRQPYQTPPESHIRCAPAPPPFPATLNVRHPAMSKPAATAAKAATIRLDSNNTGGLPIQCFATVEYRTWT